MARYREYNYSQGKFIPIFFDKQILPGTFEHTLHDLIDHEFDLTCSRSTTRMMRPGRPLTTQPSC